MRPSRTRGFVALAAVLGMMCFSTRSLSAFAPPVMEPRSMSRVHGEDAHAEAAVSSSVQPILTAVAVAGVAASLVRRHAPRAHLVQLRAEAEDKEAKEADEEDLEEDLDDEDEDDEDEEDDEEEGDDLDEIVMEDDDEDDEDLDDDDDDFEADDGVVYGEDDLDDTYFTADEDGEPLEAVCKARFLKGSPWKFRRVLWQIRGRSYRNALMLLEFMPWRACRPTLVALQSAAANAQNHFNMDKSRLYVYSCQADRGPYSKRMRPVSKGQSHPYRRRSTHLEIRVREMSDQMLMNMKEFD